MYIRDYNQAKTLYDNDAFIVDGSQETQYILAKDLFNYLIGTREFVTESELIKKGYQTSTDVSNAIDSRGYKTEAQIREIIEGYEYKTESQVKTIVEGYGYLNTEDVNRIIDSKDFLKDADLDKYATIEGLNTTSSNLQTWVTNQGYQTSTDVSNAIDSRGYKTEAQIREIIEGYEYPTLTDVNNTIDSKGFATQTWVNEQDFQNEQQVRNLIGSVSPGSGGSSILSKVLKNYFYDIDEYANGIVEEINTFSAAPETTASGVVYALVDREKVLQPIDGLLTFFWHNQLWTLQLGFGLNKNAHLQIRGRDGADILDWSEWKTILDSENYSDIIKKINGNLLTKKGTFVDLDQGAGAGQTGYINFARITIKDNYADHTCYFGIQGRGWQFPLFLSVNFANSKNNDPTLQSFYYWGNKVDRVVYISKKTTSTWDLWCSKGGGYDVIEILQMNVDYGHFDVTFPNEFSDTRGNGISPTVAGNVAVASRLLDSSGNGGQITATYAKEGINLNAITWLACWAGYEIRAINKNCFTYVKNIDNFFGMCIPYADGHDVTDELFIRTTQPGIIPYQSGDYTNPHCSIGTESWVFNAMYTNNSFIHYLIGLKRLNLGNVYYKTYIEMDYSALLFGMIREDNDTRTPTIRIYLTNYGRSVGIYPNKDNDGFLGENSLRWKQIFTVNSVIVGSDKKEKKNISYIGTNNGEDTYMSDDTLQTFIRELKPCVYVRKNGDSGRPHHGFISQDLEELIKKIGIDHAAFIKSPLEEEYEEVEEQEIENEDGTKSVKEVKVRKTRIIEGKYHYGLRLEEIIGDIVRFIQIKDDEIQNQKKIIEDMQNRLKRLEELVIK